MNADEFEEEFTLSEGALWIVSGLLCIFSWIFVFNVLGGHYP